MEYSADQLNYFRICYVAFNLVPDGLRKIFKQEWDFRYKTTLGEWKDTPKNGADFYNNESKGSRSRNARYLATIQNGNTVEWDCSCLFFAILFSDTIGTTLSAAIRKDVDDLRQVRNGISHIGEAELTDAEFKNNIGRVLVAFNCLHLPVIDIEEVKNQTSFPIAEVNNLKLQVTNLLSELKKAKCDLQVAQNTVTIKGEQVEALESDLQVAQDTIHSKEEQVECLTQEINSRVSSFCNLACKPSHEVIMRTNEVAKLLKKMQELEEGSNGAVSAVYLSGNPGCGKSQLARQVGEQLFGEWSGDSESLFFVETLNAETLETLTDSYITLASELGVTEYTLTAMVSSKEENSMEKIKHLKRLILPKIRKFSKWLIIADNVIDFALVRSLLPQTSSNDWGNGQVLITTQNNTAIPTCSPHTYHESLSDGMQPDDAVEVLTQISQITDQEQAKKVAEVLDYQPLALAAAAFYVRTVVDNGSPNYTWLAYLETLGEGLREATEEPLARASAAYSKTMTAAIAMAINRAAETDEVLRETFHFLSLCGSESLPIQAAVKFVQARTTSQTEELIRAQISTSSLILCICEEDGAPKHLRLHNAVSETMKKVIAFDLDSQERIQCIAAAIKVFQYLFDEQCNPTTKEDYINLHKITSHSQVLIESATCNFSLSERSMLNDLIPSITPDDLVNWLFSAAYAWYVLGTDVRSADVVSEIACTLLRNVSLTTEGYKLKAKVLTVRGRILYTMQKYNQALEVFQEALVTYKIFYGDEHDEVVEIFNDIGIVYTDMREDNQAKHYLEKVLIMKQNKYGKEHAAVARIYISLGNFLSRTGQKSQAIEYYEKAHNIFQQTNDLASLASCFTNMGNAYEDIDVSKAIEFYLKSLDIKQNMFGEEHITVAEVLYNIGLVYPKIRETNKAIECFQKARAIKEKMYGKEHDAVAKVIRSLATVYREIGEHSRAIELFEKELKIRVKVHGEENVTVGEHDGAIELSEKELLIKEKLHSEKHEENRDIAANCCRLATCYSKTGQQTKAIELYERALNILKSLYGEDNHSVASCYNNLGNAYSKMNQNRQAIGIYEKAIAIAERVYSGEHESVAIYCRNLAAVYKDIGEYTEAIELYKDEMRIRQKISGDENEMLAKCYNNLGSAYRYIEEPSQAIELFEKELKIRVKIHGEEHGTVAECYNNLARVYDDTGEHGRAIELFEKELLITEKLHSEKHEENHDEAANCCRLATCYSKTGQQTKAIELYERALNILKRLYGEDNHTVASCYNNLGIAYSKMNQNRQAIGFCEKAIAIVERIDSGEHESVAIYCRNLAAVYKDIGEYTEAIELYKDEMRIRQKISGDENEMLAKCYNNLGSAYRYIEEPSQAIELFEKELKIRVKIHGEEHGTVAECYNNLARVYDETGEHSRAIELFEKELLIKEKLHSEKHEENHDVAANCCRLATCYSKTGQQPKAIELYERALNIFKSLYGEDNHSVASCYNNLGNAYSKMNQNRQAIGFYEKAIAIVERIYSGEHGSVAIYCHNLADVYEKTGEYIQAIELYKKEIKIREKIDGEEHEMVAKCYKSLASVYGQAID